MQLDRLRYQVMLALDELFSKVDALIGPFMTGPMLVASNFTGHPCLHLRAGFLQLAPAIAPRCRRRQADDRRARRGEPHVPRPAGHFVWGRLFEEGAILSLGLALERELGVAAERPTAT